MINRMFGNAVALWAIQAVNYIVPFIVLVHLTNVLGLEVYGVLAFSQGVVLLSLVLIDFGYGLSATNKISKYGRNKKYVSSLIGGVWGVQLCLYCLCAIAILIYAMTTVKYESYRDVFVFSLLPIAAQGFSPVWFFHGIEKMKYLAITTIASKVVFIFLILFFVKSSVDYYLVPFINGVGQLVTLIGSIFLVYKLGYEIKFPSVKLLSYCFRFTRHFFVSRLAVASYMNGAVVVLGLFANPVVVAVYSMAEQLYKVMQSALAPVASAAYPYMEKEKDVVLMLKLMFAVVAFAFLGAVAGYFLAPSLVIFVFDETWSASIPVLNVFLVAIVVHSAAMMTGYPLAAIVGRFDVANSSVVTGAIVYFSLLGLVFLFDVVEPTSLAIIMLVSEFFVFIHRSSILFPVVFKFR